ncbi:MAG: hypothetical protein IJ097_03915 [Bacilli bacterium]|nr:hypothetical protein [Bacilli bacterium]
MDKYFDDDSEKNDNKQEQFKSMAKYFTKDLVFSKRKYKKLLISFEAEEIGISRAVYELKHSIIFDIDNNRDIVKSLLESGDIDKKTCDRLIVYLDKMLKKQMEFIDNFDYSKVNLKENVKVKRKKR